MAEIRLVAEKWLRRWFYFSFVAIFALSSVTIAIVADVVKKIFMRKEVTPHGKSVIITGCDSGFGHALAKRLDSKGFHVFATCLFPEGTGARELRKSCSDRLQVLHMDVTKDESVEKAFEHVKENLGSSGLWSVVNNAGIMKPFTVEVSSIEDFRDCLEVNLLGSVRVTKAFLPLLKQTRGRIVNVTSSAGELSLPFFTPYTASKYAAVGFTDCLRFELRSADVSVVSIEPEMFSTGITCPDTVLKIFESKLEALGPSFRAEFDGDFAANFKDIASVFLSFACPEVGLVVDDLERAVGLEHPHHTYKPRAHLLSRFICFCYESMPRSGQILLMNLAHRVFFSESKTLKNLVLKIRAWL